MHSRIPTTTWIVSLLLFKRSGGIQCTEQNWISHASQLGVLCWLILVAHARIPTQTEISLRNYNYYHYVIYNLLNTFYVPIPKYTLNKCKNNSFKHKNKRKKKKNPYLFILLTLKRSTILTSPTSTLFSKQFLIQSKSWAERKLFNSRRWHK